MASSEVASNICQALLKGHGGDDWAKRLLSDGLHFTEEGQKRAYDIIEDVVRNWGAEKGGGAGGGGGGGGGRGLHSSTT